MAEETNPPPASGQGLDAALLGVQAVICYPRKNELGFVLSNAIDVLANN